MPLKQQMKVLAVFLATSGHSGVDRIMGILLPSIASRGIRVDLLHVEGKGPHIQPDGKNLRVVELGSSHSFTSLRPLIRYLKQEKPDVLLSDKDRVNQVAIAAKWMSGVKTRLVLRSGTTITKALEGRDLTTRVTHYFSMRYLYKSADAIMTPSEGSAMDLAKFAAIPRNKITVIPNPVDFQILKQLASEPPKHKWFNPGEPPVVVGLGELGGSKDYETLIKAFSKVRHKRFLRLFIMGRGKNKRNLEKLSSDLGVTKDIEFFGFVKNPFPYLSRASLFVHSSRYEGFGMALLEALALGVPVVATDCPFGPRDILQNGLYGALVPIGDSETMAKHMALILDTPPAPSFLVQAAQPYSLENVTEQYMQTLGLSQIA